MQLWESLCLHAACEERSGNPSAPAGTTFTPEKLAGTEVISAKQ